MNESDCVDLLGYWADLGQRVEPPVDSSAVRSALAHLLKVVDQFAKLPRHECEPFVSSHGEPALQQAAAALQNWWIDAPVLSVTSIEWTAIERSVATLDFAPLTKAELARLCCWVAAVRTIDDATGWLRGQPEWAGVITYPGSIQVPESTWLCADVEASDAWVSEVAGQLKRYVGRKARSNRWLKARLVTDDGDRRGQLPGLLVCSWLVARRLSNSPARRTIQAARP